MKYTSLGIVVLALMLIGAACNNKTTQTNTSQSVTNTQTNAARVADTLELQNLGGAEFAAHTAGRATAGSFSFSKTYLDAGAGRNVPAYFFGQTLPGRATTQLNPNLEFGGMPTAVTVVSASDGIVVNVRTQAESNDAEVFIIPRDGSQWTIGYDHLTDVSVRQGDQVTAGQMLGKAARENNGMYRYELQVNKDVNGVTTFYCPTDLLSENERATTVTAIEQFIEDWNTFFGSDVYGSVTGACAKPTLTLAETQ